MSRPIIKIHNVLTNEIVEREMNNVEFAQYETDQITYEAEQARATAKAALLTQLGITAEQAKLLLS